MATILNTLSRFAVSIIAAAAGIATAALITGMTMTLASRTASALPVYAQQTGKACGYCHVNPAGGGKRTAAGEKFAANGHKF